MSVSYAYYNKKIWRQVKSEDSQCASSKHYSNISWHQFVSPSPWAWQLICKQNWKKNMWIYDRKATHKNNPKSTLNVYYPIVGLFGHFTSYECMTDDLLVHNLGIRDSYLKTTPSSLRAPCAPMVTNLIKSRKFLFLWDLGHSYIEWLKVSMPASYSILEHTVKTFTI